LFKQYDEHWTSNAPNSATRDYNAFIRDTNRCGGRSIPTKRYSWGYYDYTFHKYIFASHPDVFEQATAEKLGRIND